MKVLFVLVFALSFIPVHQSFGANLEAELIRLDKLRRESKLTIKDKKKLSELYFLTSRCDDVKKLLQNESTPLVCACGGSCPPNTSIAKLMRFKELLQKKVAWNNSEVKSLWRELREKPEAQYWAIKALRERPDAESRSLYAELSRSLQSLDLRATN